MVSGPVIEVVKGGLIVDIGLRGFLPASLVELRRVRELQPYVGKVIEAKIIELDRNRNNVVLSRRAWLEEAQKEQRGDFLQNLKPGERRKGVVSSVVNFGAFVDLGGMDGLVHVSELSWKHVDHPSSVVAVGDEIEVEVLDVDLDKERITPLAQGHPVRPLAGVRRHATPSASSSTAASPSWCPSAPSCRWATGSRAWCTSRRWRSTTSTCPSRWSRPARSCGSRSSTSTCSAGASRCRSSRRPRAARSPRSTARPSASTPTTTRATTSAFDYAEGEFTPETEAQAAWADFAEEVGHPRRAPSAEARRRRAPDRREASRPRSEAAEAGRRGVAAAEVPAAEPAVEGPLPRRRPNAA